MLEDMIYFFQIVVLLSCIYMTWRSRYALNGLTRGIILLLLLLIARRINDAFGVFDSVAILILSSAVVLLIAADLYYIYRQRDIYAMYQANWRKRIAELENQRRAAEARSSWDDETIKRYL